LATKKNENSVNAPRTNAAAKKPTAPRLHKKATPVTAPVDVTVSQEDIAKLAYALWESRGCPAGSGEEDWFAAETQLKAATTAA
jgi:hypothetical protein